jgi:glyoxylase-like metal-dependent hydrolase (beta-lactamase superfamily II)
MPSPTNRTLVVGATGMLGRPVEIAPGVSQIALAPLQAINAYLVGSALVDAGIRASSRGLLATLAGRPLTDHVLTHAHTDHQGASAATSATFSDINRQLGPILMAAGLQRRSVSRRVCGVAAAVAEVMSARG